MTRGKRLPVLLQGVWDLDLVNLKLLPKKLKMKREEITNFVGTVPYLFIKKVQFIV